MKVGSVAGLRGGLAGDRGALWWEFHRLIAELNPTWVVGENVPGLLSSRGGADFETIVRSLTDLGYGVVWRVLDAQWFGVASWTESHQEDGTTPTWPAGQSPAVAQPRPIYYSHDYNQDRVYDPAGISEAVTTARKPNFLVGSQVRRLTPLECERLQGFPDGWTAIPGNSDSQRYRQLGNAVAVPVVEWIMRRIGEES